MQKQALALRLIHETRSATRSEFLTITYDEEHLPNGLQKHDLQNFWKNLRHRYQNPTHPLKYLGCGEYGDITKRPHYHAGVTNLLITDQKKWIGDNNRSEELEEIWGKGIITISQLTHDRARYVAGYVLKKAGYKKQTYCDEDGVELQPPFRVMSQGLGKDWIKKYATDVQHGYLMHDGAKHSIPRYYRDRIKKENPQLDEQITIAKNKEQERRQIPDKARLKDAEKIKEQQIKQNREQKYRKAYGL